MLIEESLKRLKSRIDEACLRVGRDPEEITLIAVTKTVEPDMMKTAQACGIKHFGENRVQEILRKQPQIVDPITWHLIGHLQTNKVKQIIGRVDLIHSVDSERLIDEISLRATQAGIEAKILLQLNIAEEASKFGIETEQIESLIHYASGKEGIRVCGLMTIGPFTDDPEDVRIVFKELKKLYDHFKTANLQNIEMQYLSMGMTGDFEVAIEEGSNMIRVGTGIFGARDYSNQV